MTSHETASKPELQRPILAHTARPKKFLDLLTPRRSSGWPLLAALGLVLLVGTIVGIQENVYWLFIFAAAWAWVAIGAGVNVTSGTAGIPSLHAAAVMAISSFSLAIALGAGIPFLLALLLAIVIAVAIGSIIILPILRLNGFYLAIASFALVLLVDDVINSLTSLTGGPYGKPVALPTFLPVNPDRLLYFMCLVSAVAGLGAFLAIRGSKVGIEMRASRDSVMGARAIGISPMRARGMSLIVSNAIIALGSAVLASAVRFIDPSMFELQTVLSTIIIVAVGGADWVWSPVLGAAIVSVVPDVVTSLGRSTNLVIDGALFLVLVAAPEGLFGTVRTLKRVIK